jgi:hypothetical protein
MKLYLENNKFSGEVPTSWSKWADTRRLPDESIYDIDTIVLANNRLSGNRAADW